MELFVARLESYFNLGDPDELIESDIPICVGVEELENGFGVFFFHIMFGFHESRLKSWYLKYSRKSWTDARPSRSGSYVFSQKALRLVKLTYDVWMSMRKAKNAMILLIDWRLLR